MVDGTSTDDLDGVIDVGTVNDDMVPTTAAGGTDVVITSSITDCSSSLV